MASITRTIESKAKDVVYAIDGVPTALINEGNILDVVAINVNGGSPSVKQLNKLIAKAKAKDGIKHARLQAGELSIETDDAVLYYHRGTTPVIYKSGDLAKVIEELKANHNEAVAI